MDFLLVILPWEMMSEERAGLRRIRSRLQAQCIT